LDVLTGFQAEGLPHTSPEGLSAGQWFFIELLTWIFAPAFQAEGLRHTSPGRSPWVHCPLAPLQANGLPHHISQSYEGMFAARRSVVWTSQRRMMQAFGLQIS
jgi:hypothetical protein